MRVIVLGASGPTGLALLGRAVALGHGVTGFARRERPADAPHEVAWIRGDVTDAATVAGALRGQQAVLCAVGPVPGSAPDVCSVGTRHVLAGMEEAGVRRLVCVTGAMAGPVENLSLLYRLIRRMIARSNPRLFPDRALQEALIRESAADWVILRPPRLTGGPGTGHPRAAESMWIGPFARLARADLAAFAVSQLEGDDWLRRAVYVRA